MGALSALAAGCPICPERRVDEDFEQTSYIHANEVSSLVAEHGGPLETCEDLCEVTMEDHFYEDITRLTLASCSTDVPLPQDAEPLDSGDTGEPLDYGDLGTVTCAGHVVGTYDPTCK